MPPVRSVRNLKELPKFRDGFPISMGNTRSLSKRLEELPSTIRSGRPSFPSPSWGCCFWDRGPGSRMLQCERSQTTGALWHGLVKV